MQIDRDVIERMEELGYAILPGELTAQRIAALRGELEAAISADLAALASMERHTGQHHPDRWMVHNAMLRGAELARLIEHETMQAYFSHFLGEHCILYSYQTSSMPPGGSNYSNRIHIDCPRLIPGYHTNMGALFTLDDLTEENGATYVLPGSHKSMAEPSEAQFNAQSIRLICPAGSLILLNPRTWHRGGVNRTAQGRHMLTIGGCRSYMRSRFDYPRLIAHTKSNILDIVGPVGRRFLGYHVRMPATMEEYYLPADQRLYLANQG